MISLVQRSCMWHKSLERSTIPMPLSPGPLFCTWCHYVCLFCFCCWISRHHRSGFSRPISSRDFKSDKILTSATAQQLNETIEGCRFNTGVCVRELSPHPATDAFVMGAHVLLKVHNTKKCCQKKTHHWYIWSQPISPVKIREDEKRIPRCDHQNRLKLKMCTYMMWHLKLSYVNCTWEWCLI